MRLEMVARFLKLESTMALATATAEGSGRVAPLFYLAQEGLRLFWFSSPASEHSGNLERNRQAAVAVYHPTAEWKKIRGVQMRGSVSTITDDAARRAVAKAYAKRFQLGKRFAGEISKCTLYCFQPEWVRYLDNSKRFGYRFELSPGEPRK